MDLFCIFRQNKQKALLPYGCSPLFSLSSGDVLLSFLLLDPLHTTTTQLMLYTDTHTHLFLFFPLGSPSWIFICLLNPCRLLHIHIFRYIYQQPPRTKPMWILEHYCGVWQKYLSRNFSLLASFLVIHTSTYRQTCTPLWMKAGPFYVSNISQFTV